jgi:hypothetical protein
MVPEDDEQPVRLFHTSLRDFLTTRARSQNLFINPVTCHLSVAIDCLTVMTAHHGDIVYEIQILKYAARSWCHHLLSAITEGGGGDYLFSHYDAFMNTLIGFVSGALDSWVNSIILLLAIDNIRANLDFILQVGVMHY